MEELEPSSEEAYLCEGRKRRNRFRKQMTSTLWPKRGRNLYPLGSKGGRSALGLAFLRVAGLGDREVENERDLKMKRDVAFETCEPAASRGAGVGGAWSWRSPGRS